MALLAWQTARVIRIEDETPDTKRYWMEVPSIDAFHFKPGQFVTLDLPIHEKANKRWRSYSIASWPDNTNVFELVIVLDKKGSGTTYLFNEVQVGSELTFRGPQGVFLLREPLETDIFMICTGTGVAPFRSMLHDVFNRGVHYKNIYLLFGCRTRSALLYYQEFLELSQKLPRLHYIPTLSRETWEGKTGYVHPHYEALLENRQPAEFYICGWKGMIDEARKRIAEMGYDKKSIHFELYG
jgi:ferredoxin-NADP reductase